MEQITARQQPTAPEPVFRLLGSMSGTVPHDMLLSCPFRGAFSLYEVKDTAALEESRSIWNLVPGNLLLVLAGQTPVLKAVDTPLHFNQFIIEGVPPTISVSGLAVLSLATDSEMPAHLSTLMTGLAQNDETNLLLQIVRLLKKDTSPILPERSLPPSSIQTLKYILDTRYAEKLTLDSLSKELHWNKYKLDKDFKRYYNCSPFEYLLDVRVAEACRLLRSTRRSVLDIGFSVGVENTSYFIRLFRKRIGMSPLAYRTCFFSASENHTKKEGMEQ